MFDRLILAVFLAHHHSGQNSRGYSILSRLVAKGCRWTSNFEREAEESEYYQHLLASDYLRRI